ncbi:MAG TPA: hypothetical protein VN577_15615 [Terriglobales bacterium]|nr:hypothetical protein [Terriglobales bacterium]
MKKLLYLMAVMLLAAGMSMAQTGASGSASTGNDQTGASAQGSVGSQGAQGSVDTNAGQTGTADQNATAAGQNAGTSSDQNAGALPQTASPLPLLAMLGLGSLGTGLVRRFRK